MYKNNKNKKVPKPKEHLKKHITEMSEKKNDEEKQEKERKKKHCLFHLVWTTPTSQLIFALFILDSLNWAHTNSNTYCPTNWLINSLFNKTSWMKQWKIAN